MVAYCAVLLPSCLLACPLRTWGRRSQLRGPPSRALGCVFGNKGKSCKSIIRLHCAYPCTAGDVMLSVSCLFIFVVVFMETFPNKSIPASVWWAILRLVWGSVGIWKRLVVVFNRSWISQIWWFILSNKVSELICKTTQQEVYVTCIC